MHFGIGNKMGRCCEIAEHRLTEKNHVEKTVGKLTVELIRVRDLQTKVVGLKKDVLVER